MPRLSVLGLLLLSCLPALSVRAQPRSDVAGYREATAEAESEYDSGHYPEARTLFARAHELYPNARSLRSLGVVSFQLRRYSDCVTFLEQALASTEQPLDGSLRASAQRLLGKAQLFVARIELTVEPAEARLEVDAAPTKSAVPKRLLLDIGAHQLEFSAPDYLSQSRSITVDGGEQESWNIELTRAAAAPSSPVAPRPSAEISVVPDDLAPTRRQRSGTAYTSGQRWGLALGGTALALGATSYVLAGVFTSQRIDRGESFRAVDASDTPYVPALDRWEDSRSRPYAFAAVGAASLSAGAAAILLSVDRESYPWWAASLTGLAGVGLTTWGAKNVASGAACGDAQSDQRLCSKDLERRDRGAIVLTAALPLLLVPVIQLVRWAVSDDGESDRASRRVGIRAWATRVSTLSPMAHR